GQAGTDAYGNGYPAGISVFGPDGRITLSTAATWTSASGSRVILEADEFTASTQYQPADTAGVTWQPGVISAILTSRLGVNTPSVAITSPHARGTAGPAEIRLHGSGPSNGSANEVVIDTQSTVMTGDTKCEGRLTAGNILSGRLTVTPVANQWTDNINVVFSRPFATKPEVMVTPSSSAPAAGGSTSLSWATSGVTATGFTLRVLRGSATAMEFSWFAMATT
ncbi:H-type lectin domain-containing protein, partial [Streptomyces sp. NPDC087787]|uniref:H-type lectin domain-containing protein n=1 Tax=Streptomyces sp. NPDC087787 TaxID=3365803 RepID=UPI00381F650B